ncbi:nitroreductase family protein [Xylanimonas oleitrophica]|uniref:Nitroreductase family protein n=1 Tax=Xylanimonas oleitrophica TaxID=2607479 RepID=A0A2W5YC36_9MICO|nr:nitroreductase family protein [Xylanimonas oleitrophica]PZR51641.1 nitroreductase family protein [Xylanimonas oleitrophica]
MEFQDVVRRRRMVRSFTDEPVAPEHVDRLLSNAVRAPSAGFTQGWSFLVLEAPQDRERFWAAASPASSSRDMSAWRAGMGRAPLIVVPMASKAAYLGRYAEPDKAGAGLASPGAWTPEDEARWPVPYWHVDAGMASLLILQTAVDLGLGACFFGIGAAERPAFHEAFGVPAAWEPTGAIAVGHRADPGEGAAGSPSRRRRRPLDEVVHRGRFGA